MIAYGFIFNNDGIIEGSTTSYLIDYENLRWDPRGARCVIWILRDSEQQATSDAIALRKSMLNAKKGEEYNLNRL